MRRTFAGVLALTAMSSVLLVLPVYAAPEVSPHPVEPSVETVSLGSVVDPTDEAVVATDGVVQPDGAADAAVSTPTDAPPADAPSTDAQSPTAAAPSDPQPTAAPTTAAPGADSPAPTTDAVPGQETGEPAGPGSPADDAAGDVVVSGAEVPGLPALTVSRPSTDMFSTVGITWQRDAAVTSVVAQIRVLDAAGQWGEWTTLTTEDSTPGAPGEGEVLRDGTSPYWTGDSFGIEAIVQGAGGVAPGDVQVTLIDPGTSPADAIPAASGPTDQAHAAEAMPQVITRAQWGADESIRTWDPQYAPTIKAATIHHTADGNNYTAAQVPAMMRSIYAYHAQTLGWGDIGYNVIVDKYGRIFEGRYGGLTSTVIGAHAGGFNTGTFGVSMLGNYDLVEVPQATVNAIIDIVAWKLSLYGVNPAGTTVLTSSGGGTSRYAAGTRVTLPTIFAHRDVGSTVCPGRYGYARMDEIRAGVAGRAGNVSYVKALYRDMMVRDADAGGLADWTSQLYANGDRRVVSRGFSNSIEYRTLMITQAYQQLFNRTPDAGGMSTWLDALASGRVTIDNLRPTLMTSAEFYLRGGGTDAGFVNNAYQAALGRSAAPSEIAEWGAVRRTRGAQAVLAAVWYSPEAAMRRVDQTYQYYLGRPAGESERQYWLGVVLAYGDERLREEVVVSYEYLLRAKDRFPAT